MVLVAHHPAGARSGVEIMEATIVIEMSNGELPIYALYSLEGERIVRGDSGGGVWYDGQLVGNMWVTSGSLFSRKPTRLSVAAALPSDAFQYDQPGPAANGGEIGAQESGLSAQDYQLKEAPEAQVLGQKLFEG